MRLTLFYAGLFLLLGTILLAIVYLLTSRGGAISVAVPSPVVRRHLKLPNGLVITLPAPPAVPGQDIVTQQHNADLARLVTISWIVLLVTTAGAAVLGWFAAGRVLRPVREITATARTISAGNLHERLARTGPNDEFKQLGDTLDDLFGRLEASFEAQRRFVANASHELRTPLTLERTLLQVALADPNATERTLRATCEELLTSQADQERLLEALLTLASSERGLERRDPVDLPALVESALRQLTPKLDRRGISAEVTLGPATPRGRSGADRALDREPDRQRDRPQRRRGPGRHQHSDARRTRRPDDRQHRTTDPSRRDRRGCSSRFNGCTAPGPTTMATTGWACRSSARSRWRTTRISPRSRGQPAGSP